MNIKKFFINFAIITVMTFLMVASVNALEEGYCVIAEVSDISPSSIGVNEEFTVGIQIENCGDEVPEYVSFELLNPPIDITIKEPLIINIPKLYYANSERFITYHMKTTADAQPGIHLIKTRLSYGKTPYSIIKNYNITIDVIGERAELSIASLKTMPVLPRKGETVELILRIENTGDGTAKSVNVYANHSFQGLKQSFIGALDSNEDGPAILTFIVDKPGEFEFPVIISYKDDFGDNEIQSKINLTILRKKINWFLIVFLIAIISFAIWGFRNYAKLKRSKNKVIHQLLGGGKEESEEIETPEMTIESNTKKGTTKRVKKIDEEKKKKERRKKEFKEELLKKYKK